MIFDIYEYCNQGGRSYNEDATGYQVVGSNGVFVVADGLGGHSFGEVASRCVVDTFIGGFTGDVENAEEFLANKAAESNDNILKLQQERNTILKSTVVSLIVKDRIATCAHVGDSRLYYFRDGELNYYTEDHSVAYKKYKAGEITREEICMDEDQSRLLRSLGGPDHNEPVIHTFPEELLDMDAFFLCSDGAWEFLRDEEIAVDLLKSGNAQAWCEKLLVRMMERIEGENDNLSLMTIIVRDD